MNSASDRTFVTGATFDELYSLFLFDRYSRNIFFKNLLIIENRLKSVISYQMSKKYGYKEKDYLNPKDYLNFLKCHFVPAFQYRTFGGILAGVFGTFFQARCRLVKAVCHLWEVRLRHG